MIAPSKSRTLQTLWTAYIARFQGKRPRLSARLPSFELWNHNFN